MGLMDTVGGLLGPKAPKSGNALMDSLLPMLLKGGAIGGLADLIPGLVDQLSPGGSLPTGNIAKSMKGFDYKSILGG